MKRLLKNLFVTAVPMCILASNATALPVFAAQKTQDDICAALTVVSGVESGTLDADFVVANNNNFDLKDVTVEFSTPAGYSFSNKYDLPTVIDVLKSGEERAYSIEYVKDVIAVPDSSSPNPTPGNTAKPTSSVRGSATQSELNPHSPYSYVSNPVITSSPTTQEAAVSRTTPVMSSPGTNDTFPLAMLISAALASGAGAVFCIKRKHGKKFVSLILVGAMCGTVMSGSLTQTVTAMNNYQARSFTVSESVVIDGQSVIVKVTLTYQYPSGEVKDEDVHFNMDNALYDEATDTYYVFDEKKLLSGIVNDTKALKNITYTITDCNDTELMSGNLAPSGNWTIDNLGLIIGENTITLAAQYEDGSNVTSTVRVNNLCEENMQPLNVDRGDNDSDGVLNFIETMYHSDPDNADSDEDSLSDYDEMAILGTDPQKKDTDENGIDDSKEDFDGDNLTNFDELYTYKTNPISIDSDGDGISDYDEIFNYMTDPNNSDTDGDEADDYWEVQNGFDPLKFDSDFGDLDPTGDGTIRTEDGTEITIVLDDAFIDEATPGYMGVNPYYVELGENTSTNISIPFDSSNLNEEDDPAVYFFNEDTQRYEEVPTTITEDGQAVATIDKSGTYVLLNRRYVYDVWENDIIPPSSVDVETGSMDIVFVIDRSQSMDSNDPEGIRKQVVKEFIEKMRDQDRAAIVQFTKIAETVMPMTNDKEALINTVDSIENSDGGGCAGSDQHAGTNGSAGIRNALDELDGSTAAYKYIIFLTDGDDNGYLDGYESEDAAYTALENEARDNVVIHTVGLVGTGDVDIDRLKQVADETHGNYYLATTGAEAEIAPEYSDALPLEDVYDDIESITIDRLNDSNGDGITDYYTKLICEGKLMTSKGTLVFGGASYDEVQNRGADFDGDGIINGTKINPMTGEIIEIGEIMLIPSDSGVYAKVNSYPFVTDSDGDGLSDYEETISLGTSPLKFNRYIVSEDEQWATDNQNFISNKYKDFYESKYIGAIERGSVWIGNNIFNNNYDASMLYEYALVDYLGQIEDTLKKRAEYQVSYEVASQLTEEMYQNLRKAIYEAATETEKITLFDCLKNMYGIYKNIDNIKDDAKVVERYMQGLSVEQTIDALPDLEKQMHDLNKSWLNRSANGFKDPQHYYKYVDDLKAQYDTAAENYEHLSKEFNISKDLENPGVKGAVFLVVDMALDTYATWSQYTELISRLEVAKDNIYILDVLSNSSEANADLKTAARNIKYTLQQSYTQDLNNMSAYLNSRYGDENLRKISGDAIHFCIENFTGVYGRIAELTITLGNLLLNVGGMAEEFTKVYALSLTSSVLANHFKSYLSSGNAIETPKYWVLYNDSGSLVY